MDEEHRVLRVVLADLAKGVMLLFRRRAASSLSLLALSQLIWN
jgi:hypothetical protein